MPRTLDYQIKMPQVPPDWKSILAQAGSDRLGTILGQVKSGTVGGRYCHWEKVRHLPPPGDLTREEYWLGLKIHRTGELRDIPLLDVKGRFFKFSVPDFLLQALHQMDLQAGGTIGSLGSEMTAESRDRYVISSLMEEAITSSQLEGATTTRPVAKAMIRSGRPPRDKAERMILNNYLTMQEVRKLKDQPLDATLVFRIHRMITEGTLDDPSAAGRFRTADEAVDVVDQYGTVYHRPPPTGELAKRMEIMCDFANKDHSGESFIHPVIRAMVLHFWLAYDHPFFDGNGRTARALFYWSMLRSGYWLFEFISISHIILKGPVQYARAYLYSETDGNDLTYFLAYHARVLQRGIESLMVYLKDKRVEQERVTLLLRRSGSLNHRQQALLSHALRHPGFQYSVQSHAASHGVSPLTARNDLNGLVELGVFEATKRGKAVYYEALPELETRLEKIS